MNNYKNFEVIDWVDDPGFRKWVYKGEQDSFWISVLENTPLQVDNIEQAREILLSVRGEVDYVSDQELFTRKTKLLDYISQQEKTRSWWRGRWFQVAAVLLLTMGFGGYYWKHFYQAAVPYNALLIGNGKTSITEVINLKETIKQVTLPDGSSVILKKNAKISYPSQFLADRREVVMQGEAFFEVQKNPDQPFYIYSGEMTTRVTGTSFSIKANAAENRIQLVVKTGVVEISVQAGEKGTKNRLTLNPNQLATLNLKNKELGKTDVDEPVLINLPIESQYFTFKKTPVKDVFRILEMAYGIHINFDQEITSKCNITARLGDGPIREKLEMICEVLNARFEMTNNAIQVFSDGCEK